MSPSTRMFKAWTFWRTWVARAAESGIGQVRKRLCKVRGELRPARYVASNSFRGINGLPRALRRYFVLPGLRRRYLSEKMRACFPPGDPDEEVHVSCRVCDFQPSDRRHQAPCCSSEQINSQGRLQLLYVPPNSWFALPQLACRARQ